MTLVKITSTPSMIIDLAYATPYNFAGKKIYQHPICYLHPDAADCLFKAAELAQGLGYGLKIFDAFRPSEAQWKLWEICPNTNYVADPAKGSPHSRGVAVDLTLLDRDGYELDMGTPFDDFSPLSHHRCQEITIEAQRNRFILLGIMTAAGWDFYGNEWWHYQLFNAKNYALRSDSDLPERMMDDTD